MMIRIGAVLLSAALMAATAAGASANAGADNGVAAYEKGMALLRGTDGAPDREGARRLFAVAAERHFSRAEYQLALLESDPVKAAEWLHDAAGHGNADAVARLGTAYLHGRGVPQDRAKAVGLFERAASGGQPEALYALASLRLAGGAVGEERGRACGYLKAAQERGVDAEPAVSQACADLSPEEGRWAAAVASHVPPLRR